jgi:hypothetical protein
MTDVQEVLRTKENELARVQREIEALRTVAVLLSEPDDAEALASTDDPDPARIQTEAPVAQENTLHDEPSPDASEGLFKSIPPMRSRVRNWFGRAAGE